VKVLESALSINLLRDHITYATHSSPVSGTALLTGSRIPVRAALLSCNKIPVHYAVFPIGKWVPP